MRRINIKPFTTTDGKKKYKALFYLPDGSSRSAGTFTNKAKAKSAAEVEWEKSRQPDWIDPQKGVILLSAYAETKWMPNLIIEPKTLEGYESTYRCHIKPTFGERPLRTILPSDVEAWLNDMEAREVGRATQRKAFVLLNSILKKARRDRLVPTLATEDIQTRPVPQRRVRIFSRAQWEKFIAEVPEQYRLLLETAIATGLRPNELRALSPSQIIWARGKILVDRALNEVKGQGFVPKQYPKGKRPREVEADRALLKSLAQEIMRRGLSKDSEEPLFLFNGRPVGADLTKKVFKAARDKAGLEERLTLKHLRSSRASWLAKDSRGDVVRVQRELGHRDIQTTMKYLAVVEEVDGDNASTFEDFLKEEEG